MCLLAKLTSLQQTQTRVQIKQCAFLVYNNLHKGFKCLDISTGHVNVSRDVIFDETIFPFLLFIQTQELVFGPR